MSLLLTPPAAAPDPKMTSYRFWERLGREQLQAIRARIETVLEDFDRQFDLFGIPEPEAAPAAPPAAAPACPAKPSALGATLSASQVKCYLDCSARWWFKYGAQLPDPAGGSLVRGRVVHRMAEQYFRARKAGYAVVAQDLEEGFEQLWEFEAEGASFDNHDDIELLKEQAAVLSRKYITEAGPSIEPAEVEMSVSGTIGGVPVVGFIDVLDVDGRIIDLKTAARKPSGIAPDYAFQVATYRQLAPGANGQVRLDTVVATKTPQLVTLHYAVSAADQLMTAHLFPHVREGIREGLYFPNRMSNLCSRKTCNFWSACQKEFGGQVKGADLE